MSPSDTRATMAQAAAQELLVKGYAGASLAAIAERLELTKGALTYHFQVKADFAEHFIDVVQSATDQANNFAKAQYPECGARRLLLYFMVLNAWVTTEVQLVAGLKLLADSACPTEATSTVIQEWLALSVDALQVCQAAGELDEQLLVSDAAEMLLVTTLGSGVFRKHVRTSPLVVDHLRFVCLVLKAAGIPDVDDHVYEVVDGYADNLPALQYR